MAKWTRPHTDGMGTFSGYYRHSCFAGTVARIARLTPRHTPSASALSSVACTLHIVVDHLPGESLVGLRPTVQLIAPPQLGARPLFPDKNRNKRN